MSTWYRLSPKSPSGHPLPRVLRLGTREQGYRSEIDIVRVLTFLRVFTVDTLPSVSLYLGVPASHECSVVKFRYLRYFESGFRSFGIYCSYRILSGRSQHYCSMVR